MERIHGKTLTWQEIQIPYLEYLGGSLICWCLSDQGSMSTSTAESESKAVNHTLNEKSLPSEEP